MVTVRAPATSANLGSGFDVFGVALDRPADVVRVSEADETTIAVTGVGSRYVPTDPGRNVAGVVARELDAPARIEIDKGVRTSSGLGSSAASAAGAALALNELYDLGYSRRELVPVAAAGEAAVAGEPHADNVAPALLGGFTVVSPDVATTGDGTPTDATSTADAAPADSTDDSGAPSDSTDDTGAPSDSTNDTAATDGGQADPAATDGSDDATATDGGNAPDDATATDGGNATDVGTATDAGTRDARGPAVGGGADAATTCPDVLRVDADVPLVACLPDLVVSTSDARDVVPDSAPMDAVVDTVARAATLTVGMHRSDPALVGRGMTDAVVTPARAALVEGYDAVRAAALEAGATGATVSGAGPAVVAACRSGDRRAVACAMVSAFEDAGVEARAYRTGVGEGATVCR